ncbi:hypothetical protein LGM75_11110 [Burkholderia multivorans]|uniref:hypothetical protein n=1 Tax=Burkholderia multivorans TaxID=87883 RepID=UPI00143EC7AE|nr:hypothetical protein [Burkholderia multivorans]MBU9465578.1 hypothetical protein [Burkholderia multivorans]MCA8126903.1 hypothetical protein [Burkholderia multivorans]QIX15291.1 hypothetical protein FOB32_06610 [Burkholderia multivorans]
MNTHAIVAAALTAASLSAFAHPAAVPSGAALASRGAAPCPSRALPAPRFVLAKIDQNNTPPDRGGDPSGRSHGAAHL